MITRSLQGRYFSLDPTNRIWMSDVDQYMEPVEIGDIMRAGGSIAIVESKTKDVSVGDIIRVGCMEVGRIFYCTRQ